MKLYTYNATSNADASLIQAVQQAGNRCWEQGLPNGDVRPIADNYGDQAKFYQPDSGMHEGKQAIAAVWQAAIDRGLRHVAIETHEVVHDGALGYETGIYSILNDQGIARESGHYVTIWRKENEEWKCHRSMYNYHFRADN